MRITMTLANYLKVYRGRASELAVALEVSPSLITMWAKQNRKVPMNRCLAIERWSGGVVLAERLRPDVNWRRGHTEK